ncbi:2-oxoglutarate dehydrogenase E1 component [Mesorhizobium sp. CO1-1-11]|uniref:2-oxoglutarate dehydrogenase E1 component n=1 Tax=Mesorhizobium sp. CO1-1-11 TaxID=2876636 RepID=UPI001CCA18C0|nr:2-oxoglutarate dehydrogenase E1 component [Mesorhizobium sp. CO1-1-11]MBZ9726300.1 2-oxoglutarate dehydrogenase E1 component [Mesorhizobium sp. CO1-1-11]
MNASLIALGGDMSYYLQMLSRYRRDPNSCPADWRLLLDDADLPQKVDQDWFEATKREIRDTFRSWGYLSAEVDPLGMEVSGMAPELADCLARVERHRSSDADNSAAARWAEIDYLIARMSSAYTRCATLEAAHLRDRESREWLQSLYESSMDAQIGPDGQSAILEALTKAFEFERFLHSKFPTKKRFGLEGGESFLVLVDEIIKAASRAEVAQIVIGGMHRGRLNMLVNVMDKPPAEILAEVKGRDLYSDGAGLLGDVPYHLGYSTDRVVDGRNLRLSLLPHPSHLIAVAPVTAGKARAKRDVGSPETMALILHTDAAFSGQGLISELLQLSQLAGYTVGGTIHCILNNHVGFTTTASEGRSSRYCTDIGRMIDAPIFHVNAEDVEAVARIGAIAVQWRLRYGKDVLIDLRCYRRNGHNELDEPRFTQPRDYEAIDLKESVALSYRRQVPNGEEIATQVAHAFHTKLEDGYGQIASYRPNRSRWLTGLWQSIQVAGEEEMLRPVASGVSIEQLRLYGDQICTVPADFNVHPKVAAFLKARRDTIAVGEGLNWATAEALAFASLVGEGHSVRLSGQDAVRGTFTQRHLALHDAVNGKTHLVHSRIGGDVARFEAINSPLSEFAVLSFEYGHSLVDPNRLTVWEAQFGDFVNGAQIAIDQFIVAGEPKWMRMSGLAVLLPHGLEGQGPEHSSARIERLLQMCAGGNIFVVNCSTPANFFHVLRRQIVAPYRKPLFVAAPKSLFRNRACVSKIEDFAPGTGFRTVIPDETAFQHRKSIDRVMLCSGKVAYDLERMRAELSLEDKIAIIRVEQLYPFPLQAVLEACKPYGEARLIWCQEEPRNQGGWTFVRDILEPALSKPKGGRKPKLEVVSRPAIPAPAGGAIERHEDEQNELVKSALTADAFQ